MFLLFIGYYSSITFFPHSHNFNGVTIVHSHPFRIADKNDSPKSSHTNSELVIIQNLSEFVTPALLTFLIAIAFRFVTYQLLVFSLCEVYTEPFNNRGNSLRAPPVQNYF